MASTVGTIIGLAEKISSIDRSTIGIAGCEEAMLINVTDKANREYYNKFILGGGEPRTDRTAETGGTLAASTNLNGAITSASTTIVLDSVTSYPSSGAGAVWDNVSPDFIEYAGVSTLTLTGVTGIGFNHEDDDAFSIGYVLPSNFESFRSASDSPDGIEVNGVPYRFTTGVPIGGQFSIYDNGTNKYLFFHRNASGDWSARYNKGATSLTVIGTTVDVPLEDEDFIVYKIVEHISNIVYGLGSSQSQVARQMANKIMLDALKRRNVGKRLKHGRSFMVNSSRWNGHPESFNQL